MGQDEDAVDLEEREEGGEAERPRMARRGERVDEGDLLRMEEGDGLWMEQGAHVGEGEIEQEFVLVDNEEDLPPGNYEVVEEIME